VLLALDIGNTNVVGGLFDGSRLVTQWRVSTDRERMPDELRVLWDGFFRLSRVAGEEIDGVCIASVVPSVTPGYVQLSRDLLGEDPMLVGLDLDLGVAVDTDRPAEVGVDRIVNALAAREHYGVPAIVIDVGTATTFDVVSAEGSYIGGAIAPGMSTALEALVSRASLLFRVPLTRPPHAIGRSTLTCLQSGAVFGYVGLVEGLVARIQEELGQQAVVIATGGLASLIAPETKVIDHVDLDITLSGIRLVWERNTR
jgi:type III pantothenate kinase